MKPCFNVDHMFFAMNPIAPMETNLIQEWTMTFVGKF